MEFRQEQNPLCPAARGRHRRDLQAAGALVLIDVGEEGFAHEGDFLGVVLVFALAVRGLGLFGTGGSVLEFLAAEDEAGVLQEEFLPVREGLGGERRGEG
jgi:hypothetical protein